MAKVDRERSGVLSTALRHTMFLDDPRIVRTLRTSHLNFARLKHEPISVYLVLPADKLAAYGRFARATLGLIIRALTRRHGRPESDVVLLLDELSKLGRFAAVEDSIFILRGYGVCLWLLVQDLSQLQGVYPMWRTFLANATLQAFGTQNLQTARYISEVLGNQTIQAHSESRTRSSSLSAPDTECRTSNPHGRPLLTSDEVRRLDSSLAIVVGQGLPPHLLQRLDYRIEENMRRRARENPMHRSIK
ncbi:MAG: type IV secretory system conjugative DNA transfer family protein [Oxalobacteraceae bacterium]|nr:MAG: type IV secretory system conjugative DNA transfer family protein [Oxalobacteraceae bacterium]